MSDRDDLGLFAGFGIEIEYMVVDQASLDVKPCVAALFERCVGPGADAREGKQVSWSNELVDHVIELKTAGPAPQLAGLAKAFHGEVLKIADTLEAFDARLLPTGMHPWMLPQHEMQLFPAGQSAIYSAFDKVFGCRHHGFANLQSTHLNLPFQGDEEFGRLHAAVRAVLPLIPALAASSPFIENRDSRDADHRLTVYRDNCRRVPSITGQVIPEPIYSIGEYHDLLQTLYRDIAPFDPDELLRMEWLNSRGAIARFERNCIELRLMDAQECPRADLAIVELIVAILRALCDERWATIKQLQALPTTGLVALLDQSIVNAEHSRYEQRPWLGVFGARSSLRAQRLLGQLSDQLGDQLSPDAQQVIESLLRHGSLATRLRQGMDFNISPAAIRLALHARYQGLAESLQDNQLYLP